MKRQERKVNNLGTDDRMPPEFTDLDRSVIRYIEVYGWGWRICSVLLSRRFGLPLDAVLLKEKYLALRCALEVVA